MSMRLGDADLTPAGFEVLLALASGAGHGYAVMQFSERMTHDRQGLPAGTLYRTLGRLVADGLVEETGTMDPNARHDARRRYYQVTERGREAAAREARRIARLTDLAREAGLLVEDRAS